MEQRMTEKEYNLFTKVKEQKSLTVENQEIIATLHAKYYKHQFFMPCSCSGKTWKQWVAQLNDVYANGY